MHEGISATSSELTRGEPQWDDVELIHYHDIQARLCLLFLALKQGPSIFRDQPCALIVMETSHPGHFVRLGIVDVHCVGWWAIFMRSRDTEYVEGYHFDGLTEEYNNRLKEMLAETDTQIVTLL